MNEQSTFDWSMYENGFVGSIRLTPNPKIKGTSNSDKCYSRESYAQDLFNIYTDKQFKMVKKDLAKGDCALVTSIISISKSSMEIEIEGGLDISIDLKREKRFIEMFGYTTIEDFVKAVSSKEGKKQFIEQNILAYIVESAPSLKISLWQGYLQSIKSEFMEQIDYPNKAYTCTIKEANKGGFFVDIMGVDAFMPGSLAAPNKIADFQSYVGKQVIVMVEDFLKEMNSFIVSHKKYIDYMLPKKLSEIDFNKKYTGTITGTSKYGIFIEFDEFFTALLHVSKMKDETKKAFESRQFMPNDTIYFYISEVNRDNRIILTEESPEEKYNKIKQFIFDSKDNILESEIVAIMNFGIIVNVGDVTGLVPSKEFRRTKKQSSLMNVHDKLMVKFDEFRDEKIVFSLS
jgi:predicted RNA-binding protein with RPS1 domain